ncbi:hypothetical protein [Isoptericola sp. BMS4]|uniref:AbiTii domain-containing protein n=1 Tax=Isoptericola sp. BMS4 TaxID=2527875 RepID=UPI00141E6D7F|nr:hypothetical protein [Isoptericola sp. BMS4]
MSTALAAAIDALSDPQVRAADALRRLLVVSRRAGADELTEWLRGELSGYSETAQVPTYRSGAHLPIKVRFDGPMGSSVTRPMYPRELPDELSSFMESLWFREPIAELESLATGDSDPSLRLPNAWLALYRDLVEQGKVPTFSMMSANDAHVAMPRTHLLGSIDQVKSTALDLALSFEEVSTQIGNSGGPTASDQPQLREIVHLQIGSIYADGATITIGNEASVASGTAASVVKVQTGDVSALLDAAQPFLDSAGIEALSEALQSDGQAPAEATRSFLDRVKSGSVSLAAGVTTNAAYAGLVALLQQAFPGFLG